MLGQTENKHKDEKKRALTASYQVDSPPHCDTDMIKSYMPATAPKLDDCYISLHILFVTFLFGGPLCVFSNAKHVNRLENTVFKK